MLWDIIRDWFVQYIFGGIDSAGNFYGGVVGYITNGTTEIGDVGMSGSLYFPLGQVVSDNNATLTAQNYFISVGDWLSTTATIITLVLLVVMLLALVRFIIRQVSGLFAKI